MIPSPTQNNEPSLTPHTDTAPASINEDGVEILCEPEASKGPKRRDLASHQSFDTADLIRFVVSPDGILTPDLAHKLPGRGMWVKADRQSLEVALKKNLFARSAKRQVRADPALSETVHRLLRQRCLETLGLARREGQLLTGFEKILAALKSPKPASSVAWLIEASDGAEDGRSKLLGVVMARQKVGTGHTKVAGCFNNDELSLALGLENAIHVAILEGRRSERWSFDIKRLAGFEPLLPPDWPRFRPDEAAEVAPSISTEDG